MPGSASSTSNTTTGMSASAPISRSPDLPELTEHAYIGLISGSVAAVSARPAEPPPQRDGWVGGAITRAGMPASSSQVANAWRKSCAPSRSTSSSRGRARAPTPSSDRPAHPVIDVDHREAGGTLLEDAVSRGGSGITQLVNAEVLAGLQETPCPRVIDIVVGAAWIGRAWTESLGTESLARPYPS
jgi:hypothetical protein